MEEYSFFGCRKGKVFNFPESPDLYPELFQLHEKTPDAEARKQLCYKLLEQIQEDAKNERVSFAMIYGPTEIGKL